MTGRGRGGPERLGAPRRAQQGEGGAPRRGEPAEAGRARAEGERLGAASRDSWDMHPVLQNNKTPQARTGLK